VVLALRQWGEDWGTGPADIILVDKQNRRPVRKVCVQSEDGRRLTHEDLIWVARTDVDAAAEGKAA
jgi:hypothetical protein